MTHLLIDETFISHSGLVLPFKIEGDALSDATIATAARVIGTRRHFGHVIGVPRGGLRLAEALKPYRRISSKNALIVDDVLTTGGSMETLHQQHPFTEDPSFQTTGIVLFARGPCSPWVTPFFTLHEAWR